MNTIERIVKALVESNIPIKPKRIAEIAGGDIKTIGKCLSKLKQGENFNKYVSFTPVGKTYIYNIKPDCNISPIQLVQLFRLDVMKYDESRKSNSEPIRKKRKYTKRVASDISKLNKLQSPKVQKESDSVEKMTESTIVKDNKNSELNINIKLSECSEKIINITFNLNK